MWRYIEEYNYAETWRDPDDIHYENEKYFNTLGETLTYGCKTAEKFGNYIKGKDFRYHKDYKSLMYTCSGSYAPTLIIAKTI